MIKRTVEISQEPFHLTVRDRQLLLLAKEREPKRLPTAPGNLRTSIPCEDVGVLLVDHGGCTYTHAALAELVENDAAVILCGRDHLPTGILLPLTNHTQVVWRIDDQINLRPPLRKQLWRQIVQAKIRGQASNFPSDHAMHTQLMALSRRVRSGDPDNMEARAARAYWIAFFGSSFRRDPDRQDVNRLLNYGYTVLRAAVARAIVGAGLLPMLGLHHRNRSNAFCLADDLVEPLRPLVDDAARHLADAGQLELQPHTKRTLLEILTAEVRTADFKGPLMVALHRYVASFARCLEARKADLDIPIVRPAEAQRGSATCS
jgi:CRISPR-associated protein Cas1